MEETEAGLVFCPVKGDGAASLVLLPCIHLQKYFISLTLQFYMLVVCQAPFTEGSVEGGTFPMGLNPALLLL